MTALDTWVPRTFMLLSMKSVKAWRFGFVPWSMVSVIIDPADCSLNFSDSSCKTWFKKIFFWQAGHVASNRALP